MVLRKFAGSIQHGGRHYFCRYFATQEEAEQWALTAQSRLDSQTAARRALPKGHRKGVAGVAHIWEKVG